MAEWLTLKRFPAPDSSSDSKGRNAPSRGVDRTTTKRNLGGLLEEITDQGGAFSRVIHGYRLVDCKPDANAEVMIKLSKEWQESAPLPEICKRRCGSNPPLVQFIGARLWHSPSVSIFRSEQAQQNLPNV